MAVDDRWWGARPRLQVTAWRGNERIVVLSPMPERPTPGPEEIRAEVSRLFDQGVQRVLTGALHHGELAPFEAAGFVEHERLHLLRHDLALVPDLEAGGVRLRRSWRRDLTEVLSIDGRAFDSFWALDRRGLDDAVRATPSSHFRVATVGRSGVTGYAITGRAADRGYLQRLAVEPGRHRQGIGRALVIDGLTWLRRSGARVAVVNTQEHNDGAIALYRSLGFVNEPRGLTVLTAEPPP